MLGDRPILVGGQLIRAAELEAADPIWGRMDPRFFLIPRETLLDAAHPSIADRTIAILETHKPPRPGEFDGVPNHPQEE